jgi:2-polyprenyl-3-methyl-5-hydroxy-6-metoxy-1,4-benzoquinol methylase
MYRAYNLDRTRKVPRFVDHPVEELFRSYVQPARLEAELSRLMLHYTRLDMAGALLDYFLAAYPGDRSRVRVVDYGSGAADFGLAFALMGFHVTLVDIAGGKVEFGSWRLARRGLAHDTIPISAEREYPAIGDADVVVAGDLLEHLRDPCRAINLVADGLRPGGHFWFPDFPFKEKSIGGQHLQSAADLRAAAADLVSARFTRAGGVKYIMRVRPTGGLLARARAALGRGLARHRARAG